MKVFVKCKQCGGETLIPEASSYSEEDFKKFSGIAVCSHCGMGAPWTGEELIKKDEPKKEEIVKKVSTTKGKDEIDGNS